MKQKSISKLLFLTLFLIICSCRKELSQNDNVETPNPQSLQAHNSKVETWIKLIPTRGKLSPETKTKTKCLYLTGKLYTRIQVGENGSSLLFISGEKQFQVFGLSTKSLSKEGNGIVDIFDFQSLEKKGLRFAKGKLAAIQIYPEETTFNAYENIYNINNHSNTPFNPSRNITLSHPSSPDIIKAIRKFFCQLFGGSWTYAPYSIDTPTEYCATGGPDVVQELPPPDYGGGGGIWGLIYPNINNLDFFDFSSSMWNSIMAGLNAGGISNNWLITTPVSFIDQECEDPDKMRALFYALNTYYNQQPSSLEFETLDETLDEYKLYKAQQQVFLPIIPMLIKAGANGAADALMQALFIYLTEDDCPSYGAAFGHDKFSKTQVARSAIEGLLPWRTPGGKLGRGAFTAVGDVVVNLIDGKYGTNDYEEMGMDFMLGFFSDLAGGAAGELTSKYAQPKIGKGLLNKFGIHYKTVASWLGGGLQQINKSFTHNGQTITASRIMKGFADKKVVVIGRNMDDRVVPFAEKLSQELGFNVVTIKQWSGWNPNLTVEQNKAWLQQLKNEGYTFYDIGLDPSFTATGNFLQGPFYSMELNEIFR